MKKIIISCLILICCNSVIADDIYRWTDSEGNVYLSDKPRDGATKITLPKENHSSTNGSASVDDFRPPVAPPGGDYPVMQMTNDNQGEDTDHAKFGDQYNLVAIVKPADNQTVHGGTLDIQVELQPMLFDGDLLELYVDNHKVASSTTSLSFTMHNVDRGTHQLQAKIIGQNGDVKASSSATTVHIQRPMVKRKLSVATVKNSILNVFNIRTKSKQ